ncbi:MAG: hypothetical protein GY754_44830 [bacterium]|nr:hypothetical protein [bacterium]
MNSQKSQKKRMVLIKMAYWFGICADALWAVALFSPQVFGLITGNPDFSPNQQMMQFMWIGGVVILGWTVLLIWAVREPVERRGVILITAFPVVAGLFVVALIGFLNGNTGNVWILFKTAILFISMVTSYILAGSKRLS